MPKDLLTNRFQAKGLYLLGESESALSPQCQLAALCRLHDLIQVDSQFIIATHSPLLLAYPDAQILLLDERGITETAYDDVPLVRVYRGILANPQRRLREMLVANVDDD